MEKVVTINLNGNAYQLDETAYAALRAYLDQANARLADNPDRAEIVTDLEQAIAEKCARFLGPHKTVVTAAEMDQIVKEMGPVEGAAGQPAGAGAGGTSGTAASSSTSGRTGPKRLYRIREGAMLMGVCNGLAAYAHVDVVFVRIAFVVATVVTFGWGMLGYWLLTFIIPEARTADEHAAAHGQAPFNAQDVIDEARRAADTLKAQASSTRQEWRRQAREQRRQWRTQARAWRQQWRSAAWTGRPFTPGVPPMPGMPVPPVVYPPPMWSGPLLPIFGLVSFAFFLAMVLGIISIVSTGALWGWPLPDGMPIWAGVLVLVLVVNVIASPFRAARRAYRYGWGWHYAWFAMWDGLIGMAVIGVGVWLLFHNLPPTHNFHEFVQNLPEAIRGAGHEVASWFRSVADKF
jgi:phage shock protein PspC (stress-responsive transcriptional regulator)